MKKEYQQHLLNFHSNGKTFWRVLFLFFSAVKLTPSMHSHTLNLSSSCVFNVTHTAAVLRVGYIRFTKIASLFKFKQQFPRDERGILCKKINHKILGEHENFHARSDSSIFRAKLKFPLSCFAKLILVQWFSRKKNGKRYLKLMRTEWMKCSDQRRKNM